MSEGSSARYLAPAALIIAALAIIITWQSSLGDDPPPEPARQSQTTETTQTTEQPERGEDQGSAGSSDDEAADRGGDRRGEPGAGQTYRVQPGDSLATIAAQTGVDVDTLMALNEDIQPQNLQPGDELQLRP